MHQLMIDDGVVVDQLHLRYLLRI